MMKILLWKYQFLIGILLLIIKSVICNISDNSSPNCLNNLPITELLKIQHSLDRFSCSIAEKSSTDFGESNKNGSVLIRLENSKGPFALPLVRSRFDQWEPEKPTKLQTFFQISITALAFLAFGGYLLCMIVQAIKAKGTTYFHPVATSTTATTGASTLKRIKIYRRSRRMVAAADNSTENEFTDDLMGGPSPDEMYKILLLFAEGYVKIAGN